VERWTRGDTLIFKYPLTQPYDLKQ